jgi:hypothetical protein
MSDRRRGYVAYLLRLWQVGEAENMPWRASLESTQTGQRQGFGSLPELFAYLENEVAQGAAGQAPNTDAERGVNQPAIERGTRFKLEEE